MAIQTFYNPSPIFIIYFLAILILNKSIIEDKKGASLSNTLVESHLDGTDSCRRINIRFIYRIKRQILFCVMF